MHHINDEICFYSAHCLAFPLTSLSTLGIKSLWIKCCPHFVLLICYSPVTDQILKRRNKVSREFPETLYSAFFVELGITLKIKLELFFDI